MLGQSMANASVLIRFILPAFTQFGTREALISGVTPYDNAVDGG